MKRSIGSFAMVYPAPVFAVGTYDRNGNPNVMAAAWGGICCSSPPCIAVSLREATYTYKNIMEQKAFTISIPPEKYVKEADYIGLVSGKREDKFAGSGLTPVKSDLVYAPYVKEFPFVLECSLMDTVRIGLHTQFIGEIRDIKVDEEVIGENGIVDIEKVRPIIFAPGSQTYHGVGKYLGRAFNIGKDK